MRVLLRRRGLVLHTEEDITSLRVDVIVNSANAFLGGIGPELPEGVGGVDGAIHRAAGIDLLRRCEEFPLLFDEAYGDRIRCAPGDLRITDGYRLACRHVFHAVGPKFRDGLQGEWQTLERLYERIFDAFRDTGLRTIALPPIGTRSYGIPKTRAALTAMTAATRAVERDVEVIFALLDPEDVAVYEQAAVAAASTRAAP
jgi:O-acetyl-ADP-ribose deacetylase (regulator of RNase III)